MGIKQIPTKKFIKFLKSLGLVYIRTEASHDVYDHPKNPLNRPVIVRTKNKDIPVLHIHTNLKTIGIDKSVFEEWLKKN